MDTFIFTQSTFTGTVERVFQEELRADVIEMYRFSTTQTNLKKLSHEA